MKWVTVPRERGRGPLPPRAQMSTSSPPWQTCNEHTHQSGGSRAPDFKVGPSADQSPPGWALSATKASVIMGSLRSLMNQHA